MQHRTWTDRFVDNFNMLLLSIIAATMILPFMYIIAVSFSSMEALLQNDFLIWPERWVTDAYTYILSNGRFVRSIWVTIYITLLGTFLNLVFTTTMAYALSRNFHGQKAIMMLVLFTFIFSAGIIPTYLVVKATGLIDTIWSLIVPGLISSWNLIVIRQFFKNIPEEIHEVALIDGANYLTIFWRIILPLSKPALATFGMFYAVNHWNSYFNGILYINNPSKWPIQVLLRQIVVVNDNSMLVTEQIFDNQPAPESAQMAAILLATIPILLIYPFLQKHFAKGVMLGSIKG